MLGTCIACACILNIRSRRWHSQVTTFPGGAAVTLRHRQFAQTRGAARDLALVSLNNSHRIVLGTRNVCLAPGRRSSRVAVLHQQMSTPDLAVKILLGCHTITFERAGVVHGHVMLERVAVGVRRWLPSRLLCLGVEVVRQVLAVGVPDLPACWQSGRL